MMENKSDFNNSLSLGQKGESLMSNFFLNVINSKLKKFRYSLTEFGDNKDWDFKALAYKVKEDGRTSIFPEEDKIIYAEVKTDFYERRTGNMFIELTSRGRKSGLNTTKSNYYIYFFIRKNLYKDNVYIIKTEKLKELIKPYLNTHCIKGGDYNSSLGVILPIREVISHFEVHSFDFYNINEQAKVKKEIVQIPTKETLEDYLFGKLKNKNENEQH